MSQPKMTSKTSWASLTEGNLIFVQQYESGEEYWLGPLYVVDSPQHLVRHLSGKEPFRCPEGKIVRTITQDKPTKIEHPLLSNLTPVPPWVTGQEHDPAPVVLMVFTEEHYTRAKQALENHFWRDDVERVSHLLVKTMWERAKEHLQKEGKVLGHIDFHPGGMMRAYEAKETDEALRANNLSGC
jgi:hypothetical protein